MRKAATPQIVTASADTDGNIPNNISGANLQQGQPIDRYRLVMGAFVKIAFFLRGNRGETLLRLMQTSKEVTILELSQELNISYAWSRVMLYDLEKAGLAEVSIENRVKYFLLSGANKTVLTKLEQFTMLLPEIK